MANLNIAIKIAAQDSASGPLGSISNALGGMKDAASKGFTGIQSLAMGALGALAVGAVGAATALTGLVLNSAATADEMVEMAAKTGLSTTQLQEFSYIGEQTGTSLETVTGSLVKLTRNMDSARTGTGGAADAFAALGIDVVNANGELRDSQTVFMEAIDALGEIENTTERDALAMALFGKSAQELNPLIAEGSDGLAAMAAEAESLGAVMSEEAVTGLADLNDMVAGLKLGFQGWIGTLASGFLPIFQTVIGAVQGFLQSPAVQGGLQTVIAGVTSFTTALAGAVELLVAGDAQGALSAMFGDEAATKIMNIVLGIQGFVTWVTAALTPIATFAMQFVSWQDVLTALGIVVASVVLPALAGIVAAALPVIAVGAALIGGIALVRTAWEENWGGIRDVLTQVWTETLQPALMELWTWLQVNVPIALTTLSNFWTTVLQPALTQVWAWMTGTLLPLWSDLVSIYFANVKTGLSAVAAFWTTVLQPALTQVWGWMTGTLFPALQVLWDWLATNVPAALQTLSDFWTGTLQPALAIVWGFINDSVIPLLTDLWTLIDTTLGLALTVFAGIWQNVLYPAISDFWTLIKDTVKPGLDLLESFWTNTLKPAFENVTFLETLGAAFDGLGLAIKAVRDFIQSVITKLGQMGEALPDWAIPGSPMPLETAMWGLGRALEEVGKNKLPRLNAEIAYMPRQMPGLAGAGAGGGGDVYNYNFQASYARTQGEGSLRQDVRMVQMLSRRA